MKGKEKMNKQKQKKRRGRPPNKATTTAQTVEEVSSVINAVPAPAQNNLKTPKDSPQRDIFTIHAYETIPRKEFKRRLLMALNHEREKGREYKGAIESNHVAFLIFEDQTARTT